MPVATPPPPQWEPPLATIAVARSYRPAPRFVAGGRRAVRLRASAGQTVVAPCAGRVVFSGRVAGSPPLVTLSCGGWRATLSGLSVPPGRGRWISAGAPLGRAGGGHLGLSARDPTGTYRDPIPLLRGAGGPRPPVVVPGARRDARRPRPLPPARLPPRAMTADTPVAPAATPTTARPLETALGMTGVTLGVLGLTLALSGSARRRTARISGRLIVAHRVVSRR